MHYRYSGERFFNMGAIDIGTNSCRLLISKVYVNPQKRSHLRIHNNPIQWRAVDSFCRIVRLGEDLTKTGNLTANAIQRTLDALEMCYKKIRDMRVSHLRVIATEACRKAHNADELIDRAKQSFGLKIEVISGSQEAQLALLGCCEILNWSKPYALIFDIGGGSTELIWIKLNSEFKHNYLLNPFYQVLDSISLPYGVVTVNDTLEGYCTKEKIFEHVYEKVSSSLLAFCERNRIQEFYDLYGAQMIGSSGTVTAFGAMHLGLKSYDRRRVDGMHVLSSDLIRLCQNIDQYCAHEEQSIDKRADLMNVGGGILMGILKAVPIVELTVADRGVREGIIVDLIRRHVMPHFQFVQRSVTQA